MAIITGRIDRTGGQISCVDFYNMKIIIQAPHLKPGDLLFRFVHEAVEKLSSFSDALLEARVTLKLSNEDVRQNKICTIRGVVAGDDLFAEKYAATFREAATEAVDALRKQLAGLKGRTGP